MIGGFGTVIGRGSRTVIGRGHGAAHDRLPEMKETIVGFRRGHRIHQTTVIGGGGITVVRSTTARGGSRT